MTVSYDDFLDIAESAILIDGEPNARNAASRSYYAAYHSSIPIGEGLPKYRDVSGGVHAQHIAKFIESGENNLKSIGYIMNTCKAVRHKADYDLGMDLTTEEAIQQIANTKRIIKKVNEYLEAAAA